MLRRCVHWWNRGRCAPARRRLVRSSWSTALPGLRHLPAVRRLRHGEPVSRDRPVRARATILRSRFAGPAAGAGRILSFLYCVRCARTRPLASSGFADSVQERANPGMLGSVDARSLPRWSTRASPTRLSVSRPSPGEGLELRRPVPSPPSGWPCQSDRREPPPGAALHPAMADHRCKNPASDQNRSSIPEFGGRWSWLRSTRS